MYPVRAANSSLKSHSFHIPGPGSGTQAPHEHQSSLLLGSVALSPRRGTKANPIAKYVQGVDMRQQDTQVTVTTVTSRPAPLHLTANILHPRGETAMGNFHHQKALVVQATLTRRLRSGATTGAVNAGSLSVPAITAVAPGHTTLIVPRACRSPKSPSSLHCT